MFAAKVKTQGSTNKPDENCSRVAGAAAASPLIDVPERQHLK